MLIYINKHGHQQNTLWIHVVYKMQDHGHKKYTVDLCHIKYHSHEKIQSGSMSQYTSGGNLSELRM